ncbi:MAG: bifunctional pyr operon transcriptional regulator/uracil phosphoribosyltransferase PyrR, partial [Cyclobacteriaceae bacterium]
MEKRQLFDSSLLRITISRLCHQLIERHDDFSHTVFLGLQPRGIYLAERITAQLEEITGVKVPLGYLDTTFHRDDF